SFQLLKRQETADVSILFRRLACHRKRKRRNKRRNVRVILSVQFAIVRFYDSARPIQTKTIMTLGDFPKRFASPILRRRIKARLWLMKREQEPGISDFRCCNNRAFATIMEKGILGELAKYFLQKLWINI